ncbi:DEAD/DEAH box helicase family protein [Candidatus Saccharibacteria bacterium]|nr:DEAD/DEAH box helicase family protein [Candidatus Saccharibacteria bacterium]
MKTRRYQDDALLQLMTTRESGSKRALVVMAPSLGKTVVSAMDAQNFLEENPEARALYLCHTNEVLEQAKKTFKKVFGDSYSYGLYNGLEKSRRTDFLFASFQTMNLRKFSFNPDEFSYIIVDEAHHAPANTFKEVIGYFKPEFLLGLTATPNRLDGLDLSEIFGETVYTMDLIDAIANGYVANVDYRLVLDEMAEIDSIVVDGEKLSAAELNRRLFVPKRDEEIVRLIKEKSAERRNPRTMIFCRSVEHAENIARLIDGAEVVHSRIDGQECLRRIARFRKGQTTTIVSVDQLNEGVDIPQADVIVFLRSTVSPVVFFQQFGRGLRLHDEKEGVLILDFVGNCERLEMINDFDQEIKTRQESLKEKAPREEVDKEHFTLNIDTPKFREELVDILKKLDDLKWSSYTKEELIEALQKKARELGRTPTEKEVDMDPRMPTIGPYIRVFGNWNDALKAAGLELNRKRGHKEVDLIEALQRKAQELGRTPKIKDLDIDPTIASGYTYVTRFGSWNNALKAAGLDINKQQKVRTREELINDLQRKAQELGRTPTRRDVDTDPKMACGGVYAAFFGSWNNALKVAGLEIILQSKRNQTEEELIENLQRKALELGRTPTRKDVSTDPKMPNEYTYIRRFDGWKNALKAAGLKPNKGR